MANIIDILQKFSQKLPENRVFIESERRNILSKIFSTLKTIIFPLFTRYNKYPANVENLKIFMGNCFLRKLKKLEKFWKKLSSNVSKNPHYGSTLPPFSTFAGCLINRKNLMSSCDITNIFISDFFRNPIVNVSL